MWRIEKEGSVSAMQTPLISQAARPLISQEKFNVGLTICVFYSNLGWDPMSNAFVHYLFVTNVLLVKMWQVDKEQYHMLDYTNSKCAYNCRLLLLLRPRLTYYYSNEKCIYIIMVNVFVYCPYWLEWDNTREWLLLGIYYRIWVSRFKSMSLLMRKK